MLEILKNHMMTLSEEINYRENIIKHKKSLEATLWGLQEQIRMPENQSAQDQEELASQINNCQSKILNCNKILDGHTKRLIALTEGFKLKELITK